MLAKLDFAAVSTASIVSQVSPGFLFVNSSVASRNPQMPSESGYIASKLL